MRTHILPLLARPKLIPLMAALVVGVTLVLAGSMSAANAAGPGGGGGGGGGAPVPTQFPAAACNGSGDGANALGTVVTVPIRDANCLSLLVSPNGITVWAVTAAPGWTFNVKRDQLDEIDVFWTNVANPALTHEYRRSQNNVRVS
jgi:hypothetical protein